MLCQEEDLLLVKVMIISKVSSISTEQAQEEGREHGQEGDGEVL